MLARVPLPRSLLATLVRHWLRSEPTLQNILPGCRPGEPKTQDGNYTHFGKHVCAALPEWPSLLHFVRRSHTLWKPSSAACWYAKKLQNQTHFTLGHANMDNFFFFSKLPNGLDSWQWTPWLTFQRMSKYSFRWPYMVGQEICSGLSFI